MVKFSRRLISVIIVLVIVLAIASLWVYFLSDRMSDLPAADIQTGKKDNFSGEIPLAASVAKGLEIPWSLDFLPDGSIIFTERPGRVKLISAGEGTEPETLLTINEVEHVGEGGGYLVLNCIRTLPATVSSMYIIPMERMATLPTK